VITELRRVAPLVESGELRSFLARFLFFGEDVFKSVGDLSGGEKGRLSLAKLIYSRKNVLVLDEPTNHLDIPAREALEDALQEYDGTIITVSHDRFFLDKISTQILSFEDNGAVDVYHGNYTQYHDWKAGTRTSMSEASAHLDSAASTNSTNDSADQDARVPAQRLSKNQRTQIENRIKKIETKIAELEDLSSKLSNEMSDPKIAGDFEALNAATEKHAKNESSIKQLYSEWEELASQLEGSD
jgi:ATP-binding cassette subfamily F protein 3